MKVNKKILIFFSLILTIILSVAVFSNVEPVLAKVIIREEAPLQTLSQARHRLEDNQGNLWQVILFKRTKEGNITDFDLRLVAFPETVNIEHPAPLLLQTLSNQDFQSEDLFAEKAPGKNVGQYNVAEILPQVITEKSLILEVPVTGDNLFIKVPFPVLLEWQEILNS